MSHLTRPMSRFTVEYSTGVSYRSRKSLDAKIPGASLAYGSAIEGEVDQGWLKVPGKGYLPVKGPNGEIVLREIGTVSRLAAPHRKSSDDATTDYMQRFDEGLKAFEIDSKDDPYMDHYSGRATTQVDRVGMLKFTVTEREEALAKVRTSSVRRLPAPTALTLCKSLDVSSRIRISDRPLLCLSIHGDEAVIGSSDHALYKISVSQRAKSLQLYTSKYGHTEWVTTCAHTLEGKVLSGGMDGKLCLWTGATCVDLKGHVGSVSRVRTTNNNLAVTCSYDRSVKLWDLSKKRMVGSLHGHSGAVVDLILDDFATRILSVGRDSLAKVWDIKTGSELYTFRGHKGHATACCFLDENIAVTGAQDGVVCSWDMRTGRGIASKQAHEKGASVSILDRFRDQIISSGADGQVSVLSGSGLEQSLSWNGDHSLFIYSMHVSDSGEVITGGGEGTLARRNLQGQLIQNTKVFENAIRCIGKGRTGELVVCGDDGEVAILNGY